jgi:hypothetical protein
MVDLSMDGLQAGKEFFPRLADLVPTLKKVRAARRNEEDLGVAGKQATTFSASSSVCPSRSWWSSSRFAAITSLGKAPAFWPFAVTQTLPTERYIDKGIRVVYSERLRMWLPFLE